MLANNKSNHANIVFLILLIIGFVLLIARLTPAVRLVKNFIYYVSYPSINTANQIFGFAGSFADKIKSIVYANQENIVYKQQNQLLLDKLRNYDVMSAQYENLTGLLKIPKVRRTKSVFAKISIREPNEWYQWFIIDKGSKHGLHNGLPVVMLRDTGELCAVGQILETYGSSAKVALITNVLSSVPVEIKGKRISCLAEGFGSNVLKITYIPSNANVEVGDEVIASPLGSVFHEGLAIAKILSVSKEVSTDFKTAVAEISFESESLYEAVILVPDGAAQ
ncbi:rod shape-determining protein MreC [Endomicrobium proavitum]|uniref:Cell shape-determining protein MreC n=1 Tax=Endomicrobium proavitum TaxID=1408281 RepID=A0A0G3WLC6_9BACT|nr:rod shape-determining protein MreC [Endomicrobium proavitum]AKL98700.1 Rod shape-determining protein MreC [Endomicrobium proavitum]